MLKMSGRVCASAAIALTNVGETPLFAKDAGDAVLGTGVDNAAVPKPCDVPERSQTRQLTDTVRSSSALISPE